MRSFSRTSTLFVRYMCHISGNYSCECEGSVSVLRLLKTYLRSTIGQDRLSSLALAFIHRTVTVNITEVPGVKEFARRQPWISQTFCLTTKPSSCRFVINENLRVSRTHHIFNVHCHWVHEGVVVRKNWRFSGNKSPYLRKGAR